MKRILLICAACCALASLQAQQGPYYLMFNLACMDQLEYRTVYSGNSTLSFNFRPSPNEQYILTGGSGGITAGTLPKGAKDCRDVVLDETMLDAVNNLTKQMYVVQQTQQGYVLTPIVAITHITRSGTYYIFRSTTYSFALDTTRLMYGANLANVGSPSAVYFTALKDIYNCRFQYSFRREPTRANMEKSEFEFIPGIGLVSDKPGMTATEAETNQSRLWAINGRPLDEYLATLCGRQPGSNTAGVPQFPNYPAGGTPIDKEEASINYVGPNPPAATVPANPTATVNPQTGLANCPEPPGKGYHIVQPGQGLMAISRTYNIKVANLVAWNNIKNPDKIEVCQKIWLMKPPANAVMHSTTPKSVDPMPAAGGPVVQNQSMYWNQAQANPNAPAPVQHSTPTAAPVAQAIPDYWGQIAGSSRPVLVHVVQKGETLSGLARHYGYTEERFRKMNGIAATGDYRLAEAQQLVVSDCEYDVNSPTPTTIMSTPPATYNTPTPTTNKVQKMYPANSTYIPTGANPTTPSGYNPQPQPQPYNYDPVPAAKNPATTPSTVAPNQFTENSVLEYDKESYVVPGSTPRTVAPNNQRVTELPSSTTYPSTYNNVSGYVPPVATPAQPSFQPAAANTPTTLAALREYTVQQGDTVRSIAIKFNVNQAELAVTNGLDQNESLVPGKRLLIPKQ